MKARGLGTLLPLIIAALAFGTSSPLARLARPAHPLSVAAGRVLVAGLVLSLIDLPGLVRALRRLSRGARLRLLGAGLVLAGHFGLFQWGLETTSLPAAVSLVSLEPLAVVLTAWWLFGVRPSHWERAGVAVASLGALIIAQSAGEGEHRLLGDLLVLGAVGLFGLYVAAARALRDDIAARYYAPAVYSIAALVLVSILPFLPSSETTVVWPLAWKSMLMIALVGLIPTVIGHTLLQVASRTLPPSLVALVSPGETLGSILLSMLILGGHPSAIEAIGAVVILGGAGLAIVAVRRGEPPSSDGEQKAEEGPEAVREP